MIPHNKLPLIFYPHLLLLCMGCLLEIPSEWSTLFLTKTLLIRGIDVRGGLL